MSLSPDQCRAARGLLGLSQANVAEAAHLTAPTIRGFERHGKAPSYNNLQAIQRALEAAGVVFVAAGQGGPGVRLSMPSTAVAGSQPLLTPGLCRAGRYMLSLSQQQLAEAAGVARSTVAEFERGAREPATESLAALRDALESSGLEFLSADDANGPGVRTRQ